MNKAKKQILEKEVYEKDNALEGVFWSLKKRLQVLDELYQRLWLLSPYSYKPFVKSFGSFKEYETWKKRQKNPWHW